MVEIFKVMASNLANANYMGHSDRPYVARINGELLKNKAQVMRTFGTRKAAQKAVDAALSAK